MLDKTPTHISVTFILTTILTLVILHWTLRNSSDTAVKKNTNKILLGLIVWLGIQAFLSLQGTYHQEKDAIPPKIFLFGVFPYLLLTIMFFFSKLGRRFIDSLPLEKLIYLNVVRIPVEFGLLWLFLESAIPQIMTFEGWNFDILAGLTAPLIAYFGFQKKKITRKGILLWNYIGLGLLLFIFIIAILSSPFPLQQLAFEQPNIGILYFPFSWLPTFIAPLVIVGHLIAIRQLSRKGTN